MVITLAIAHIKTALISVMVLVLGIARVCNNTISECGLYGISMKTDTTILLIVTIILPRNCYAGALALSDNYIVHGKIQDNLISDCFYGLFPTDSKKQAHLIA